MALRTPAATLIPASSKIKNRPKKMLGKPRRSFESPRITGMHHGQRVAARGSACSGTFLHFAGNSKLKSTDDQTGSKNYPPITLTALSEMSLLITYLCPFSAHVILYTPVTAPVTCVSQTSIKY